MVRLLTLNFVACNRKQCQKGFPLEVVLNHEVKRPIEEETEDENMESEFLDAVEDFEVDFNEEQVRYLLENKIDYDALLKSVDQFNTQTKDEILSIPPSFSPTDLHDDLFLRLMHHVLLEIHIQEGALKCPKCERIYPVSRGIPNMILTPEEC